MIEVLAPGFFDTVQDLGRVGYRRYGVTASGAVDSYALRAANLLVGNVEGAACLEMTLQGPRLRFARPTLVALAGADLGAECDGARIRPWRAFIAPPNAEFRFNHRNSGCRAYLAVAGGIATMPALGSRSTWSAVGLGGVEGRALRAGDALPVDEAATMRAVAQHGGWRRARQWVATRRLPARLQLVISPQPVARVILGPQDECFGIEAIEYLDSVRWRVSERLDRMGVRLEGPPLRRRGEVELVSDGIAPGSLQVPPDGQPIVILADGQTTGGYPKIATVISADLPIVGQLAPGDTVQFALTTIENAKAALAARLLPLRAFAWAAWRVR